MSFSAPETKQALEFLYKAQRGGYFDPGQLTVDNAAVKAEDCYGESIHIYRKHGE